MCGNSRDVALFNTSTFAVSTPFPALKSRTGVAYGGCLVCGDSVAGSEHTLKLAGGILLGNVVAVDLDAPIVRVALFGAKVAIATRTGLWLLAGRPVAAKADDPAIAGDQSAPARWSTDPEPFVTSGLYVADEDHKFLLSHGGRLYTWLANEVLEFNPSSQKDGWRAVGLEGRTCHGATVAGGRLIVTLTTRQNDTETWAWDGSGWWLLLRAAEGTAATRCWPVNLAGAGNKDLLLFRDGSTAYDLYRLVWRSPALHNYRGSASFRTSLLDAGERDKTKAWRKIGATFAAPETRGNAASADQGVLTLSYSLDGGATYVQDAQQTVALAQGRILELDAALAANAASSRWLQLKVDWSSVVDWAPVLTSTWAEYELLDAPARRRRWSFKIHARDATIERSGITHPRTGRQLAADLWTAWQNGATVPFKDLDHDADPTTRQVRIVGIAEEIAKAADAARWGDATLSLTLVEV